MLKRMMTSMAMLCIAQCSIAQFDEIKIKYGPEADSKSRVTEFLGEVDGTVIYSGYKGAKWCIGGINAKSLTIEYETPMDIPEYNGKKVTLHSQYVVDGELLMFYTYYDKNADKNFLFAQRYTSKGKPSGNLQKLKEISADSKKNKGSYSVTVDQESNRVLLYSNPPFDKYSNEKFGFTVLDKQLAVIWEEDLELPYKDKFFTLGDYMIDENDELYTICAFDENANIKAEEGRKAAKKDAKEKGGRYFTYKILNYSPKSKSIKEFEVELDKGNKIVSIGYNLDPKGDINVSGLYGDANSKGSGIGVFFGKIDHNTKKTIMMNTKGFDKEFLEEYVGEKKAEDGIGISRLELKDFINREDGGLMVCGEIHYNYQVCTTDSKGVTRCRTVYVHGPIFTINIAPSGEIDWVNVVKKDQRSSLDGYLASYVLVIGEDGLYYIYNDHLANYNPKKKPKRTAIMAGVPKKSITAVTKVDYDGKATTEISAELNASKMLLRPELSKGVVGLNGEKLVLLAIGRKGKQKIVEISRK